MRQPFLYNTHSGGAALSKKLMMQKTSRSAHSGNKLLPAVSIILFSFWLLLIVGWVGKPIENTNSYEHLFSTDVSRETIAGYGMSADMKRKALAWRKSGGRWTSYTLHDPMTMQASQANATDGINVGGYHRDLNGRIKATIWTQLEPGLRINLHPEGFQASSINGMSAGIQVGFVIDGKGKYHAAAWSGSKESFFNLQSVLPEEFKESTALAVSSSSTKIVGYAQTESNNYHAIIWEAK